MGIPSLDMLCHGSDINIITMSRREGNFLVLVAEEDAPVYSSVGLYNHC